jgi:antitoxin CptB
LSEGSEPDKGNWQNQGLDGTSGCLMNREAYERLRWRCIRRGLLEVDIALTRFLDTGFHDLDPVQQEAFVVLADMEDHDLWHLISGQAKCDEPRLAEVIEKIRKI